MIKDIWYEDWIAGLEVRRDTYGESAAEYIVVDQFLDRACHIGKNRSGGMHRWVRPYRYDKTVIGSSWLELLIGGRTTKDDVVNCLLAYYRKEAFMSKVRWEGDSEKPEIRVEATVASDQWNEHTVLKLKDEYKPYDIQFPNAGPFFDLQNGDEVEIIIRLKNPLGPNDTWPRRVKK